MRIDDLPALSDEDRQALDDGYVALEGVPISWVCLHCKGCGTDTSEGYLCEACEGSGNSSAPHPIAAPEGTKRIRFPRLAWLLTAIAGAFGLTGPGDAP